MSSKNVIYGFTVAPDAVDEEGERESAVIDSNELARRIILKQEEEYKAKLLEEERERRLEAMRESGEEVPEGMDVDEVAKRLFDIDEVESVDHVTEGLEVTVR